MEFLISIYSVIEIYFSGFGIKCNIWKSLIIGCFKQLNFVIAEILFLKNWGFWGYSIFIFVAVCNIMEISNIQNPFYLRRCYPVFKNLYDYNNLFCKENRDEK